MNNLKNLLITIALMGFLVSTSSAKNGLLVSDLASSNQQPCTVTKENTKEDWGIIITSFTGIIITSFTGIIITDAVEAPEDCGILMTD